MRKIFLSTILFCLFLPIYYVDTSSAWSDGWHSYPFANNLGDYSISRNYGTTDWITDRICERLLQEDGYKYQWLNNFKLHILIGTEFMKNSNQHIRLNGTDIVSIGDIDAMNVQFHHDTFESTIPARVSFCYEMIIENFHQGNYDVVSYYIGSLIGYIAQSAYFPCYQNDSIFYNDISVNFDLFFHDYTPLYDPYTYFILERSNFTLFTDIDTQVNDIITFVSNDTVNYQWLYDNFYNLESIDSRSDWYNASLESVNHIYFNRMEQIFNTIIHTSANIINQAIVSSHIDGGNIIPSNSNWVNMSSNDWMLVCCIIGAVFLISFVIIFNRKKKGLH